MTEIDYFHARAVECDKLADEAREPEAKRMLREAADNLRAMAVQAERGISSSGDSVQQPAQQQQQQQPQRDEPEKKE
jgi:hypothetical protein